MSVNAVRALLTLCVGECVMVKSVHLYSTLLQQPTSKALRYGNALSRDLTVLPAHLRVYPWTEYICLCLLSRSWSSFTDPEGMEG